MGRNVSNDANIAISMSESELELISEGAAGQGWGAAIHYWMHFWKCAHLLLSLGEITSLSLMIKLFKISTT